MSVNIKEKPTNFVVFDFFWTQFLSSTHPSPSHCRTLKLAKLHLHQTFLKILNSQKCWTKTQYCEFEDPGLAMEGNWMTKIVTKKIENKFSKLLMEEIGWRKSRSKKLKTSVWFLGSRFSLPNHPHTPPPIAIIARPLMGDKNCTKKIENMGLIFWPVTQPPLPSQLVMKITPKNWKLHFDFFGSNFGSPPIAIIVEPSNLRYWIFIKHFWEFTRCNIEFESPAITMVGGTKIVSEKIGNVGRALKKTFKVWTKQVAWPSRQTSSCSIDLQGGRAFTFKNTSRSAKFYAFVDDLVCLFLGIGKILSCSWFRTLENLGENIFRFVLKYT